MADKFETTGGVAVTAEQFDPSAGKIPAGCVADAADWRVVHEGWKVVTDSGVVFPAAGDWIVTIGDGAFVVSDKAFKALFCAADAATKKTVKR